MFFKFLSCPRPLQSSPKKSFFIFFKCEYYEIETLNNFFFSLEIFFFSFRTFHMYKKSKIKKTVGKFFSSLLSIWKPNLWWNVCLCTERKKKNRIGKLNFLVLLHFVLISVNWCINSASFSTLKCDNNWHSWSYFISWVLRVCFLRVYKYHRKCIKFFSGSQINVNGMFSWQNLKHLDSMRMFRLIFPLTLPQSTFLVCKKPERKTVWF